MIIPSRMNRFVFVLYSCSIFLHPFALVEFHFARTGRFLVTCRSACTAIATRFEGIIKPPFVSLLRPFELPMVEHKGRKRVCAFLPSVATFEVSNVSEGDCFAALLKSSCHSALAAAISSKPSYQCVDRGGRCPPMTVSLSYGFFLSFTVSRFEIITLRFPVRGSSGRIELDPSCRTDHSTI